MVCYAVGSHQYVAYKVQFPYERFQGGEKILIFRQAILHALRISTPNPLDLDAKVFFLEFKLKPDHQNLPPQDQYTLIKGQMFDKTEIFDQDSTPFDQDGYIKLQDDKVKSRGQLGVVPVFMIDKDGASNATLPLALPLTMDQAQSCLKACGWDENVFWVSSPGYCARCISIF